ncbi:MAG: ATPase [Prevotella sp.]|nr:ATPase [Prevotella sp.]
MLTTSCQTLIADAGGTTTNWYLSCSETFTTEGINPFQQSEDDIIKIVKDFKKESLPDNILSRIAAIRFYGAGCTPEKSAIVKNALMQAFEGTVTNIAVYSDLLGAARGLCGREKGVACILGTGSNSCLYDGEKIVQNTPALGYILGDEGGGAVLGRMFLNAMLKGRVEQSVCNDFKATYNMTQADIIERVYRQPLANRFLASLAVFIGKHRSNPTVRPIIAENFANFLDNNIIPYQCKTLHFTGSIAYHFADILREIAENKGYEISKITQSPIDGLAAFHAKK